MVLADSVWYACKQGAAKVVDIATLTGGVIVLWGQKQLVLSATMMF